MSLDLGHEIIRDGKETGNGKDYFGNIIKENYMPDKTLGAITVMHKIEGFSPEANDWFWVKFRPDVKVMTMEMGGMTMKLAGKVPVCIDCHGVQSSNDYVFKNSLN